MKDEEIKIGDSVENLTEKKKKKIRMSFDPDKMGFETEEEGVKDED